MEEFPVLDVIVAAATDQIALTLGHSILLNFVHYFVHFKRNNGRADALLAPCVGVITVLDVTDRFKNLAVNRGRCSVFIRALEKRFLVFMLHDESCSLVVHIPVCFCAFVCMPTSMHT
jgi:hypothetical protein